MADRQRIHARGDDDVSFGQAAGDDDGICLIARDRDGPQSETARLLIEHPDSRRTVLFKKSGEGQRDRESGLPFQAAADTHAEAKLRRRVLQRDFDRVGARRRIGDRRDLPHHSLERQVRVGQRPNDDLELRLADFSEGCLGDVEDAVLVVRSGQLHHHLAGIHILACFRTDGSNHAVEIGLERRCS